MAILSENYQNACASWYGCLLSIKILPVQANIQKYASVSHQEMGPSCLHDDFEDKIGVSEMEGHDLPNAGLPNSEK